jgi:hypothetical protein
MFTLLGSFVIGITVFVGGAVTGNALIAEKYKKACKGSYTENVGEGYAICDKTKKRVNWDD